MKTISFLHRGLVLAAAATTFGMAETAWSQGDREAAHARGVDLKGVDVRGGSAVGGAAAGGSVITQSGAATGGSVTAGTVTPGTVTASAGGRQIQVSAVEAASVNVNGANAEVKVAGQTLRVEKSKLILDGKPLGNLPPETKKVEVVVKDEMLSVIGDGKELARAKLTQPPPQ